MKVFGPGEEEAFRAAAAAQDCRVLFDGRTVLVTSVFFTILDPIILSDRVRAAAAGPLLRMTLGTGARRHDGALVFKSFVNTDEPIRDVGARVKQLAGCAIVEVGIVEPRDAEQLWGDFQQTLDGGD